VKTTLKVLACVLGGLFVVLKIAERASGNLDERRAAEKRLQNMIRFTEDMNEIDKSTRRFVGDLNELSNELEKLRDEWHGKPN
jgi:hypothetical protein